ncbi:MAG: MBL fold metallo-hydrolase [Burkholderiales bacterium]
MKISFFGAAQEVTGSCYLIETASTRFLVDCGMFQGRNSRQRNLDALAFDPKSLDFVLVSHSHIDHCGLLPRLCARGFSGPIYTTEATADLLGVMLADSARIQENEFRQAPRYRRERRANAAPLYTVVQAQKCLDQLHGTAYRTKFQPHPDVDCIFQDAGHILGSAIMEIWIRQRDGIRKIVFSGDLGQPGRPIVNDPTPVDEADVLLIESTYGNRLHKNFAQTVEELVAVINETITRRQGNVVVPAFALGRTQELLYLLFDLTRQGRLTGLRVFVDSPLATQATSMTLKHARSLDGPAQAMLQSYSAGKNDLPIHLAFTDSVDDSMAINMIRSGALIIAGSGMCDGGRIRHHFRHNLGRAECAVLISGFQAEGTLGRKLVDGVREVELFGEPTPVRASIHTLGGLSAHADQAALLAWAGHFKRAPKQVYVVHGESTTALGFADLLNKEFGWNALAPLPGTVVDL